MNYELTAAEKKDIRHYYTKLSLILIMLVLFFNFVNDGMHILMSAIIGNGFDSESISQGKKIFASDPVLTAIMSYGFPCLADIAALITGLSITRMDMKKHLSLTGFDGKDVFNYTSAAIGLSTIASFVSLILSAAILAFKNTGKDISSINPAQAAEQLIGNSPLWLDILIYLYICLIGPILEELVFRGVLLEGLRKYGNVFAIIMSSVMFGLFHQRMIQCVSAIAFGLVLGAAAVKTRSLLPSIFIHILNNTLSAILMVSARFVDLSSVRGMSMSQMADPAFLSSLMMKCLPIIIFMLCTGLARAASVIITFILGMNHRRNNGSVFERSEYFSKRTWGIIFTCIPWVAVMIFLAVMTIIQPI